MYSEGTKSAIATYLPRSFDAVEFAGAAAITFAGPAPTSSAWSLDCAADRPLRPRPWLLSAWFFGTLKRSFATSAIATLMPIAQSSQ